MLKLILTIVVMLGLVLGAHYLVFRYLVGFFEVKSGPGRRGLFLALAGLSVSFPVAVTLVRTMPNAVTKAVYFGAVTWLGLLITLLVAIAASWAVMGLLKAFGTTAPRAGIAVGALLLTIGYVAFGMWNAFHPQVRRIEIALPGLPEVWEGREVVQLSDVHLGHIYRRGYADALVARVNELEPELVVITGDLYDGMGGEFDAFTDLLNSIDAERGVLFAYGNHEGYRGIERAREALAQTTLRVLEDEVVDLDGLLVAGISYPGLDEARRERFLAQYGDLLASGAPSLLLFHTPTRIDPNRDENVEHGFRSYLSPDVSFDEAQRLGFDLQLSGHTHAGQLFPLNLVARFIYRGYHVGLHDLGDLRVYISPGTGTWGPPVRTGSRCEITVFELRAER